MIPNIFTISITLTNMQHCISKETNIKKETDSSELHATISFHTIYGT